MVCEQCGYPFYSLDEVQAGIKETTVKYPMQILKEHKDTAVITLFGNGEKYKIKEIFGDNICLSHISSDDTIMLDDLKTDNGSLPYFTISF